MCTPHLVLSKTNTVLQHLVVGGESGWDSQPTESSTKESKSLYACLKLIIHYKLVPNTVPWQW